MDERVEASVRLLESVVRESIGAHEAMVGLMQRKREALSRARAREVEELLCLENEQVKRIAELEKRRLELAAKLTRLVAPEAGEPLRLAELAERCEEPARGRLLAMREQLREKMQAVREQASVARRATQRLVRHVQGLVQTIGVLSGGASAYGRGGRVPDSATAVGTINVTG